MLAGHSGRSQITMGPCQQFRGRDGPTLSASVRRSFLAASAGAMSWPHATALVPVAVLLCSSPTAGRLASGRLWSQLPCESCE